jgi:hypothetical protein
MSRIYGRDLNISNVTGINVMVNKRLEKKEAKQKQAGRVSLLGATPEKPVREQPGPLQSGLA